MLSPELLAKIRYLDLKLARAANELMSGQYASVVRGQGIEFDEVREYTPGDDVRTINWFVSARMGKPFVKIFKEERDVTVMILVDVSGSLAFGSMPKRKAELAAELAALIAYLGSKNDDKIGVILFSDRIEAFLPPAKGRKHLIQILSALMTSRAQGRKTDLAAATQLLFKAQKRKAVVFLLSDFLFETKDRSLELLSRRYDLNVMRIFDPHERSLPDCGLVELMDAESGERRLVDLSNSAFRRRFEQESKKREQAWQGRMREAGIPWHDAGTDGSAIHSLVSHLRNRERLAQRR